MSKNEVLKLAKRCIEKNYVYGTDTYFEVFLAGLHQFAKNEDALNILNGHVGRVAPVEIVPDPKGKLTFTTTTGEDIRCELFDGHHRFFMRHLSGVREIHFVRIGGKSSSIPQ